MKRFAGFLLLLFSLCACAQSADGLKIGPGDLLNMEVFDVPELKQEIRVSDGGDAEFSLLGKINIGGLTVEEAERRIAAELEQRRLVVSPQVSLLVREYATQGVAVSGEVHKPGIYQVLGPRTLVQVISEAGGLTDVASPRISIKRRSGEEETVLAKSMSAFLLHPGDTVQVPHAGIAYLVGDVARSGGYVMQDAGELSIAQLISLGGGMLATAKGSKARLVRKSSGAHEEFEINVTRILRGQSPDLPLQPDDILFIPNSALRSAANRLQNITQMTVGAAIYTSLN